MPSSSARAVAGSFRDPAGFVFEREGELFRQVNRGYEAELQALEASGLDRALMEEGLLIPHERVADAPLDPRTALAVLKPRRLGFVSYPYEWCFGQLRDAALATLAVQKRALERGMVLKDASAYNVQFERGRPLLIDALSFERYREGEPWVAYRQFCQHFLAPLALASLRDPRLQRLLEQHLDGLPLELAARLLPGGAWLRPGVAMHLLLHARFQRRHGADNPAARPAARVSRIGMLGLIDSLERAVLALPWRAASTAWTAYEEQSDDEYRRRKRAAIEACLGGRRLRTACDLGANTGAYSRLAGAALVLSTDADPWVVDANYRACREQSREDLLPLVVDLAAPPAPAGWANVERPAFLGRARVELVLALALVHHLAIAGSVPLPRIADLFLDLGPELLVEFVPETDPLARRLIDAKSGRHHPYSKAAFEAAFEARYRRVAEHVLSPTGRTLYHYRQAAT